ncbi:acyltransferase family protein [Corynebacterium lubricantis]|uniref:acyltransferase family protein n=1 Tax=Corynebacterium lubricantis TaxID=541095 RepID=UPI000364B469|nr:acyltransferase family protein [Corynebacterium lubricantis]
MSSISADSQRSSTYRFDLDGLRGYAIALVVIFHVFVGRVSGGVDVFLLLSGFFFLGSQLRYATRRDAILNPWWPIWRTARRLLPALSVVLLATLIAVLTLAPELFTPELASQFTASVLYFLNWELISQDAAYAAASVDTSPLQHLWSMSVQGQFYLAAIVFAIVVGLIANRRHVPQEVTRRNVTIILVIVTIASFLWASRFGWTGTPANYYSTFSRMWELTLGAVLAIVAHRITVSPRIAPFTAGLGVVLITITGFVIPTSLAYPGPLALLPISGAVLVIISAGDHKVSHILSSRPARWLGDIAYSLYLWHWPLLIITTVVAGYDTPPWWLGILVIVASLLLAHLTHKWIETPLRQHAKRPTQRDTPLASARDSLKTVAGKSRAFGGVLVTAVLIFLGSIQPIWNSATQYASVDLNAGPYPGVLAQYGAEVPEAEARPDPTLISGIYPPTGLEGCMIGYQDPVDEFVDDDCVYGDKSASTTVVMVGGSHTEPYVLPLDELGKEQGFKVIPLMRQICPMVLHDDTDEFDPECREWSENAFERLVEMDPDLVFSTTTRPDDSRPYAQDGVPVGYAGFWRELDAHGIPFMGLRDNPWALNAEAAPYNPSKCMVETNGDFEACSSAREMVYAPEDPAAEFLDPLPLSWSVDTADWFCNEESCPPVIGNIYVYRDQNHISNAFAESAKPLLWDTMQTIFDRTSISES